VLRFPQISRVFAEPLARKLIVQSSDDAPYPIALCFEVCIGRHVRLRYIAGKRRSRQTLENGLRKVKSLSSRRQAESQTRRTDLSSAIPRRKDVTGFALRSNGTAPAVRLQRPCTYGWVVSSGNGLSRLDTSLRDPINDVFVRQCHDCQMGNDDDLVDKPPPFAGDRRLAARARICLAVLLITPGGEIYAATLTNISSLGFRIRADYGVTLGRFLSLDVPELARYSGWVAWSQEGEFGLAVANPIPQKVIKHILLIAEKDEHLDPCHSRCARGSGN
jgi:hypothetical protein